MQVTRKSRNVLLCHFDDIKPGFEQWLLLSSDRHFDSPHSDRALQKYHLEQAKERGALVVDVGDFFDAMQGRNDPRAAYSEMRPEYLGNDYFNRIVNDAAKFLEPYAANILMIGSGNHESKVAQKNNIDLTSLLVSKLPGVSAGGYGGYIRFSFKRANHYKSYSLKYMHGWGGGGPVTRGVIDTNRQAVYLPDADIVVNGHTHDGWYVPIVRERFNQACTLSKDILHFVRTPGYKDDFGDGSGGWAVETGKPPKPKGCVWARFYYHNKEIHLQIVPDITA
jgi:predicted phosphodiesterase